jgi:hypothetical protein
MERGQWSVLKGGLNVFLMVFVMACVLTLLIQAAARWVAVLGGAVPVRREGAEEMATGATVSPEGIVALPPHGQTGDIQPPPSSV